MECKFPVQHGYPQISVVTDAEFHLRTGRIAGRSKERLAVSAAERTLAAPLRIALTQNPVPCGAADISLAALIGRVSHVGDLSADGTGETDVSGKSQI